jgi:hypothetical protein
MFYGPFATSLNKTLPSSSYAEHRVAVRGRRTKRKGAPSKIIGKRTRSHEREEAIDEIRALGIEEYCSILKF